ncbi:MAG TPA: hypothetical protein VNO30_31335 [Kofleriaceae bacterium]|nr:hypothetical protein [Kofleriaceae bacterium]
MSRTQLFASLSSLVRRAPRAAVTCARRGHTPLHRRFGGTRRRAPARISARRRRPVPGRSARGAAALGR